MVFPIGENQYNTKYITWNYSENLWAVGELDRQSWVDAPVFGKPVAADNNGNVFVQETGTLANAFNIGSRTPFAKSSPLEISQGDRIAYVSRLYPDEESNVAGAVSLRSAASRTRWEPNRTLASSRSTRTATQTAGSPRVKFR